MFRFFVDDSGKEPNSPPAYILAGWMARVDDWKRFSDAWEIAIEANNPKPLVYHKGAKYFKNNEATRQEGCFDGFTLAEAAEKTRNLASLVMGISPRIAGFTVTVPHDLHRECVLDKAVKHRGQINKEQRLPFYMAFTYLVPTVHALHYHAGFRDKIDYIFDGDKTDAPLRHCVEVYESIKESFKDEPWYSTMGTITEGDDQELLPLQAADMFAGQLRDSLIIGRVDGAIKLWEDNGIKIRGTYIGREMLEKWSREQNEEVSTKVLTRVKERRENPPEISKRRVKKR